MQKEINMDFLKVVETGSLEEVKQMLTSKRAEIDSHWLDYLALSKAIEWEKKCVVKLLLDSNCRVNKKNETTSSINTPLHNAILVEDPDIVLALMKKKASLEVTNSKGNSALHLAFLHRQEKIVDGMLTFLKLTASCKNPKNNIGLSHFHIACARNQADLAKLFLVSGVDATEALARESPFWSGYNAMHIAVECGSIDVVRLLDKSKQFSKFESKKESNVLAGLLQVASPNDLATQKANAQNIISYVLQDFAAPSVPAIFQAFTDDYMGAYYSEPGPIHLACLRDDSKALEQFVKDSPSINMPITKYSPFIPLYTPLHLAVESNFEKNVKVLLKHGAQVDFKNGHKMTPLHLALYNEHELPEKRSKIVDYLYAALKNKEENLTDRNGLSYFHVAVTRNDLPLVKRYLAKGVDINSTVKRNLRNFSNFTPLHFAVRYQCTEMAKLLVERGADINRNDAGECGTPLHLAVQSDYKSLIALLMQAGADARAVRASDKSTVLHILAGNYARRWEDKTRGIMPMEEFFAVKLGPRNIDRKEPQLGYIKKLMELGVDVNAKDIDGNTALHLACSEFTEGAECAKRLIDRGADINLENNDGQTPFELIFIVDHENPADCAVLYHQVQALKALGVKVNPKNEKCCQDVAKEHRKFDEFKKGTLEVRQKQRLEEIQKMKEVKLNENVSLYNFVMMKPSQVTSFAENEVLKQIVEDKGFKKEYPSYGYLIKLQRRKAKGTQA